jgi:DNA-binding response OmpR family regulator
MLEVLAEAEGGAVSREDFLDRLWPSDAWPSNRTVDNHVLSIRSKVEPEPNEPRHVLTVHRVGYRLEADQIEMTERRQLESE